MTDYTPATDKHVAWDECVRAARFWSKVNIPKNENHCWEWQGATLPFGHGVFRVPGEQRNKRAHSHALELATGNEVPDELHVLHSCDNPPCVNPSHLRVGTDQDNVDDMFRRRRNARRSALTDDDIVSLRERRAAGETIVSLADSFGISNATVSCIALGKTWAAAGGPIVGRNQINNARK